MTSKVVAYEDGPPRLMAAIDRFLKKTWAEMSRNERRNFLRLVVRLKRGRKS